MTVGEASGAPPPTLPPPTLLSSPGLNWRAGDQQILGVRVCVLVRRPGASSPPTPRKNKICLGFGSITTRRRRRSHRLLQVKQPFVLAAASCRAESTWYLPPGFFFFFSILQTEVWRTEPAARNWLVWTNASLNEQHWPNSQDATALFRWFKDSFKLKCEANNYPQSSF